MKIASSTIDYASQHLATRSHVKTESLKAWVGNTRPDFEGRGTTNRPPPTQVDISSEARKAHATDNVDEAGSETGDPRVDMLKKVVEMMLGHKLKLFNSADLTTKGDTGTAPPPPRVGWGMEYDSHEAVSETEQTSFQASGQIRTADGKSIDFKIDLQMSRSYYAESNVSIRAGDAVRKDPLVINFAGNAAELESTRFAFDIEGNGDKVDVANLGKGSAYVALDLNGNGEVDSGKELFGTQSGNGFADLMKFDEDGNGWIDDNDPVFSQLKAWSPDGQGGGSLQGLKALGVGALYLSSQSTPFELKDDANRSLGAVKSSSVYVNENGSTGTLQQIDLSI